MHGAAQKRNWSIWGKFKEPFPKMCQLAPRPMYINPGKYCSTDNNYGIVVQNSAPQAGNF